MTSPSDLTALSPEQRREYGFARVRDVAFDAVSALWQRRQSEGMSQLDVANALGSDPGWVSKNLRGPGNWTLRTFGALVEALNGDAQIIVRAANDPLPVISNYHAYVGYEPEMLTATGSPPPHAQAAVSGISVKSGDGRQAAILVP
jgi:transcriptional regulator with XRE-family HTH domain